MDMAYRAVTTVNREEIIFWNPFTNNVCVLEKNGV